MKKLKFLLTMAIMISLVIVANYPVKSQDITTATVTGNSTYVNFAVNAGDTIKENGTWYAMIKTFRNSPATQDVLVKLKDISGTARISTQLYGRKFETSAWVAIGSPQVYGGGGTDSTFTISNATDNRYRYYKVELVANANTQKVQIMKLEFKEYNAGQ
jgi:hypothetical protein